MTVFEVDGAIDAAGHSHDDHFFTAQEDLVYAINENPDENLVSAQTPLLVLAVVAVCWCYLARPQPIVRVTAGWWRTAERPFHSAECPSRRKKSQLLRLIVHST